MVKKIDNLNDGYVALISSIIIGAVLLTMTASAGKSGWYTRFMVLGAEAKQQSRTLAAACINEALARVMIDPIWNGDATSTNAIGTCYMYPIQKNYPQNNWVTLRVRGEARGAVTNIVSEFNMHEIHLNVVPEIIPVVPPQTSSNIVPIVKSFMEVGVMP